VARQARGMTWYDGRVGSSWQRRGNVSLVKRRRSPFYHPRLLRNAFSKVGGEGGVERRGRLLHNAFGNDDMESERRKTRK
jgi:hypothetical protein